MKKLLTKQRRCDKILNVVAEDSNNMNLENERYYMIPLTKVEK